MSEAKTMRVVQVSQAKGPFEIVTRPIPEPADGEVLVKVEACGMCHSDSFVKEGGYPGVTYPKVPGHEVIGRVVKVGAHVPRFKPGMRVGRGWHGGHCHSCSNCLQKAHVLCNTHQVTGITLDGGYAEYMTAPWVSLAVVPDGLDSAEAAPLMCAGVTVFNALRHAGLAAGDLVAVQGVGGLGHLAIQYANRMGFRVAALSTSDDKRQLATELGAHLYLDSSKVNVVEELNRLGGAKGIVCTAFDSNSMTPLINGLGIDGVLIVVGASVDPIKVTPLQLIGGRRRIMGWASGSASDSEDALNFAAQHNVRSRVEKVPFEQVDEGYQRMMANKARFRVVLVPSTQQH